MTPWVFSVYAHRQDLTGPQVTVYQQHTCAVVEAVSKDEAVGRAHRIAAKLFPTAKGWHAHVAVSDIGNVITVEGATLNPG